MKATIMFCICFENIFENIESKTEFHHQTFQINKKKEQKEQKEEQNNTQKSITVTVKDVTEKKNKI